MRKITLFLLCITYINLAAQTNTYSSEFSCGTDVLMNRLYAKNPQLKANKIAHDALQQQKTLNKQLSMASYTIPVVFHILHLGGTENIADAQVKDALRILNRDFAKENPDTTEIIQSFKAIADSVKIQFALATKKPDGSCTNGIMHYYDADTDWNTSSPTLYSQNWDATKYLNVYVVRTIDLGNGFSAAGYTYLPGSLSAGDPQDAIVVLNNYFGSIGTGSNFQSRVLTHEVGHWFNLSHVFGGSNSAGVDCSDDDFVSDTPFTPGYLSCPDANTPASYQLCTPGVDENFQNYMDYSYCVKMFTQGQALRMQQAAQDNIVGRDNLWTTTNLTATGVINASLPCVPIANFKYNRNKTCTGTPITFFDNSWNGKPTSFNWIFNGGIPATSTDSVPVVVYNTPGVYSVTYSCSNSTGISQTVLQTNIITVTDNIASVQNAFSDDFESGSFTNTLWALQNSSGGVNWEMSFDAAYSGLNSAKISATHNTRKSKTTMITPSINLATIINPALTFAVATADVNPAHINKLQVFASTDCQNTWTEMYAKVGANLVTSNSTDNPFIPLSISDWRTENVNISAIANETYVNFKFVYTRDTVAIASNIFIDNVNIQGITAVENIDANNLFSISPNPVKNEVTISNYKEIIDYKITQLDGKIVLSAKQFPINIEALSDGFYTVFATTKNNQIIVRKFVKY